MIKKIVNFIIIFYFYDLLKIHLSFAEISYVEVKSKGKAENYEIALKISFLKEAITKVNGCLKSSFIFRNY